MVAYIPPDISLSRELLQRLPEVYLGALHVVRPGHAKALQEFRPQPNADLTEMDDKSRKRVGISLEGGGVMTQHGDGELWETKSGVEISREQYRHNLH